MSYRPDVADIAALKATKDKAKQDNARIRVLTLLQEFWLDKGSTAPIDGITVVATKSGVGRWLRNPLPVPAWTAKTDWWQDTVAGDDEYPGDQSSPVKTMAEITRRLRRVDSAVYTINQVGTVASTDSVRFTPEISDKGDVFLDDSQSVARILIKGKRGTVPPTVPPTIPPRFTATSETDPKTNTQATVTDASVDWSKQIGQILEVTKGKAKGAQAVVLNDLTGGKARVSEWAFPSTGALSAGIPVVGDTYEILELPDFSAPILYAGLPSRVELGFQDITVTSPSPTSPSPRVIPSACITSFTSCRFTVELPGPPAGFPFGCLLRACSVFLESSTPPVGPKDFCRTNVGDGPRFIACGLVNARIQVSSFGRTTITNTVIQGGAIRGVETTPNGRIYGGLIVVGGKLGIFDSPASPAASPPGESAITLRRGMAMQIVAGASLYGSGNAAFGVEVREGATLAVQAGVTTVPPVPPAIAGSSTITITGALGDVQIEGAATAIPELVAEKPVPKARALATWAQRADPKTFARNVFNYRTGSRIITTP